jgi:hypothetical protein
MVRPLTDFINNPVPEKKPRKSPDKSFHTELVCMAYEWVLNRTSCGVAFKELNTSACNGEYPDVIGFGSGGHSVLVECKVTRNDFIGDGKKKFRVYPKLGMGTQRYFLCPRGVINPEDLLKGWGLIWAVKSKPKVIYSPYKGNIGERNKGFEKNIRAEHGLMYSVLRRLHLRDLINEMYKPISEFNKK